MLRSSLLIAALLTAGAASADEPTSCTLPGELVSEDASGDQSLPAANFGDIHTLHMAVPGGGSNLFFTYKMADLATLPPNTVWIVIFQTDVPPADGNEYFVAMLTDPTGAVKFVHGTAAPADPSQPAARLFTPAGPLAAGSAFTADGTITLVLENALAGGLTPGSFVYGFIPITHRITPTDGTMPFTYGIRGLTASPVQFAYDDAPDGFYEIPGDQACSGKSGILGAGALGWPALGLLLTFAAIGLRRRFPGSF